MGSAVVSPELLPQHPHALPVATVACGLRVDPSVGLNEAEVERRRRLFGRNLLAARKPVSDLALLRGSSQAAWWPCSRRRWRCHSPSVSGSRR